MTSTEVSHYDTAKCFTFWGFPRSQNVPTVNTHAWKKDLEFELAESTLKTRK